MVPSEDPGGSVALSRKACARGNARTKGMWLAIDAPSRAPGWMRQVDAVSCCAEPRLLVQRGSAPVARHLVTSPSDPPTTRCAPSTATTVATAGSASCAARIAGLGAPRTLQADKGEEGR